MSIVASIIQRNAGLPSSYVEPSPFNDKAAVHAGGTCGHSADQPGLRGHSIGSSWPYRVVGKGDGSWEVHRNGCGQVLSGLTCTEAHQWADALATTNRRRQIAA